MKRFLLALIIATVLAVSIGLMAQYYGPGYVVLSFADISIETSLIFMLGFIAIAFFLFHYLIRVLSILLHIPNLLGLKYSHRQAEKSRNALIKGLIEMSEGRFSQAEKILLKQVIHSDTALLNYLMAARCAQLQGAYDRRDEYLRLAHETTPSADIAIGITQAELQIAHKQNEQALATLNHLQSISPKHGYVKKLQARVYEQLDDWENLEKLLTDVRKQHIISDDKLLAIEIETYTGLFNKYLKYNNDQQIKSTWQKMPKHLKQNPDLLELYINHLVSIAGDDEAETLIRQYLSHHWQDSLVLLYARLNTSKPLQQLETAETWLLNNARNAALLLALGKLCIKTEFWGKARSYLESSLGIKPMTETYLQLAMLLENKMDGLEKAQEYYQLGLKLAVEHEIDYASSKTLLQQSKSTLIENSPKLKIIQ
ncbi:MAG: heme biosynthesis protein HemY [Gammaproteobacteria bacterium]|nr:heme biosynthesis protein HemY [Gammaproteobacteria bacterium]